MEIRFNGQPQEIESPLTVAQLLERMEIAIYYGIVEYNGQILEEEQLARVALRAGDALTITQFVCGG